MKKLILLTLLAVTMTNCKEKPQTEETTITTEKTVEATPVQLDLGCYAFNDSKNSVMLKITENTSQIKGTLNYLLFEKDSNTGTISGSINDGILLANYTFKSEGMESTRQVAFKVEESKLMEGYGDMNADGTTFKDVSMLKFDSKMPLSKTDCK